MKKRFEKTAAFFLTVSMLCPVLTACGSKVDMTIDLAEYIVIEEPIGANGEGTITCGLDEDALAEKMYALDELDKDKNDPVYTMLEIGNALSCLSVTAEPAEGLSNGDEVTVKATFENMGNYDLRFTFKDAETSVTVSGLKEYVTDISEIPSDALDMCIQEAEQATKVHFEKERYPILKDPELLAVYFARHKDPANHVSSGRVIDDAHNAVVVVYQYEVDGGILWSLPEGRTYYYYHYDWYVDGDGALAYDAAKDSTDYNILSTKEEVVSQFAFDYPDIDFAEVDIPDKWKPVEEALVQKTTAGEAGKLPSAGENPLEQAERKEEARATVPEEELPFAEQHSEKIEVAASNQEPDDTSDTDWYTFDSSYQSAFCAELLRLFNANRGTPTEMYSKGLTFALDYANEMARTSTCAHSLLDGTAYDIYDGCSAVAWSSAGKMVDGKVNMSAGDAAATFASIVRGSPAHWDIVGAEDMTKTCAAIAFNSEGMYCAVVSHSMYLDM